MDAGLFRSTQSAIVEIHRRLTNYENQFGRRAFFMPKASALRFHQSNGSRPNRALLALRKYSRVVHHGRTLADCFGANPVASALGSLTRRDPGEAMRTYHGGGRSTSKPELSTWPRVGTFYLAPTISGGLL